MHSRLIRLQLVTLTLLLVASCVSHSPPDLSTQEAGQIIQQAPEFNQYAELVKVESLHHYKDSFDSMTVGKFTFHYRDSPPSPSIQASVDFRYHEGKWYLNGFSYGCPEDCRQVDVCDGPEKRAHRRP